MSSTRRKSDEAWHDEAFASAEVYRQGLPGNLVARRAALISDPEQRAILYSLQQLSHRRGGLLGISEDILRRFSDELGTAAMHEIEADPLEPLPVEIVKALRERVDSPFLLQGEMAAEDILLTSMEDEELTYAFGDLRSRAAVQPETYCLRDFQACCEEAATPERLAEILRQLCLDPTTDFQRASRAAWFLRDLTAILTAYRQILAEEGQREVVDTAIKREVFETLDFALETRSFVLIEGLERMGKTVAAKAFCARELGRAVYVALEPGRDKQGFFRTLARALGTASAAGRKALDVQARVEDMLKEGHLMLVIDEAHFAYPQTQRPTRAPERLDWIRTALVGYDVPVAMISTPQFDRQCALFEERLGWNSRQFKGRIKYHCKLPQTVSGADMRQIAAAKCPTASPGILLRLVASALSLDDYLASIERAITRANYFAKKRGLEHPEDADLHRAVEEILPREKAPEATTAPSPAAGSKPPQAQAATAKSSPFAERHKSPATSSSERPAAANGDRFAPSETYPCPALPNL